MHISPGAVQIVVGTFSGSLRVYQPSQAGYNPEVCVPLALPLPCQVVQQPDRPQLTSVICLVPLPSSLPSHDALLASQDLLLETTLAESVIQVEAGCFRCTHA